MAVLVGLAVAVAVAIPVGDAAGALVAELLLLSATTVKTVPPTMTATTPTVAAITTRFRSRAANHTLMAADATDSQGPKQCWRVKLALQ